ncbi:hypothetical protein J3Q64DRAFT_1862100 [Phycomyces blakesleeanus]|uniref:Uncharacterized protein n=1 Tax=Phycomyces blakesleeanus TaxID=4837 RepID=A0ABR3AY17_PHYBL
MPTSKNREESFILYLPTLSTTALQQPCNASSATMTHFEGNYERAWWVGKPWFADGLGYDWTGGKRLVMEGSSGQHEEKIPKTVDNSVKQVHSMIEMLKCIANTHTNSSFSTFLLTKVFDVQTMKTTIILSELQTDYEGKFIQRQF